MGGEIEDELAACAFETAQHGLGCKPNGLTPAERFFDPLTDALAYRIPSVLRCASVDGRALGLRRHVRRHSDLPV